MKKLLLLLLILFPTYSFSALEITSVSDSTIMHGQSITISGTDFSSKPTAAPIHFDDFESGSDGTVIAGSNVFGTATCTDCYSDYVALIASDTEAPKYSNLNNRTNSSLNARIHFDVDGTDPGSFSDSLLCYQSDVEISGKIFTQVHVRMDWADDETTDDSYQCKMFRWVGSPSISAEPSVSFSPVHKDGALDDSYNTGFSYSGPVAPNELKYVSETNPLGDETWGVLQIWGDGDSGGSNGEIHVKMISDNEQNQLDYSGKILDTAQFWAYFLIGFTMANVEAPETVDTEFYYDDFYLDNSWARVEIGNSSTYTGCTELEVCPATAWSATSISITAKTGDISGSSWVYVTDIDGNVSAGYPVTVGEAATETTGISIGGGVSLSGITIQ